MTTVYSTTPDERIKELQRENAAQAAENEQLRVELANQYKRIDRFVELVDQLEAELAAAQQTIERARTSTGVEAWPCPLCRYEDGRFVEACNFHKRIEALEAELAAAQLLQGSRMILSDIRATIEDALNSESATTWYAPYTYSDPEATRARIDAALAWIAQQPAAPPVPVPDWSHAPKWANWWAIESDGYAVWFEKEPIADDEDGWIYRNVFGKVKRAEPRIYPDWRTTKQQRPQGQE